MKNGEARSTKEIGDILKRNKKFNPGEREWESEGEGGGGD